MTFFERERLVEIAWSSVTYASNAGMSPTLMSSPSMLNQLMNKLEKYESKPK